MNNIYSTASLEEALHRAKLMDDLGKFGPEIVSRAFATVSPVNQADIIIIDATGVTDPAHVEATVSRAIRDAIPHIISSTVNAAKLARSCRLQT